MWLNLVWLWKHSCFWTHSSGFFYGCFTCVGPQLRFTQSVIRELYRLVNEECSNAAFTQTYKLRRLLTGGCGSVQFLAYIQNWCISWWRVDTWAETLVWLKVHICVTVKQHLRAKGALNISKLDFWFNLTWTWWDTLCLMWKWTLSHDV